MTLLRTVFVGLLIGSPFVAHAEGDWTGPYVGVQVDLMQGSAEFDFQTNDFDGGVPGLFAGYRQDLGKVVLGLELDIHRGDIGFDGPSLSQTARIDRLLRLGVEAGIDLGPALVYGTAGVARIDFSGPPTADSGGSGRFFGVGVDYLVSDRVTVGVEWLRHDFGDLGFSGYSADPVSLGINLGYRF